MTTDITSASVTTPKASGGNNQGMARTIDTTGNRRQAWYEIVLTSSAPAGGFSFDPKTYGFDKPVALVNITKKVLVANVPSMARYSFTYDYVGKKIVPIDATDSSDDASGDDLSNITLVVHVVSE